MPSQIHHTPNAWKQEVNRRVAAHKNRKGVVSVGPEVVPTARNQASSRAAEAAARVAARYAKAPSYSDILASEARVAVRAAEVASRAAEQAQAAADSVLAEWKVAQAAEAAQPVAIPQAEAMVVAEPVAAVVEPAVLEPVLFEPQAAFEAPRWAETSARRAGVAPAEDEPFAWLDEPQTAPAREYAIRWEPDMPVRQQEPAASASHEPAMYEIVPDNWHEPAARVESQPVEVVEPAQPIHANLIEFPRELVATHRVRPRLAEGPLAESREQAMQLSIFEVDPAAVSTVVAEPEPVMAETARWTEPEWPAFELPAVPEDEILEEPVLEPHAAPIEAAPLDWRLLAGVVNFALILAATLGASLAAAAYADQLPTLRMVGSGSMMAFSCITALYCVLFCLLANGTPGMKYAHLRLVTFDGHTPGMVRRAARLAAMVLSALPLGLGLIWYVFDEDRLCWHDRLTRTYLRRY
jgi:uncharacterized RDD family membrane protein YckC